MATRSQNGSRTARRTLETVVAPPSSGGADSVPFESSPAVVRPRPVAGKYRRRPDYRLRGIDFAAVRGTDVPDPRPTTSKTRRRHRQRAVLTLTAIVIVAAALALVLRATLIQPFSVRSGSMAPTLQVGDHIIVSSTSFLVGPIDRGSIVVLRAPRPDICGARSRGSAGMVERVIGMPGQTISSARGQIYLDGTRLQEPGWYDTRHGQLGTSPIRTTPIPRGDYFVLGDNRANGCDSRAFGVVPRSLIVGKVLAIVIRDSHPHIHTF
jgi:signal peptidase I